MKFDIVDNSDDRPSCGGCRLLGKRCPEHAPNPDDLPVWWAREKIADLASYLTYRAFAAGYRAGSPDTPGEVIEDAWDAWSEHA